MRRSLCPQGPENCAGSAAIRGLWTGNITSQHLADAFQHILQGGIYVSPAIEMASLVAESSTAHRNTDPLDALSSREYQVFMLLVEGIRAKEIAARLSLSPKTVDTYRSSLMRKLNIFDLAGLVKFAIQRNLVS